MNSLISIDPGNNTGIAIFKNKVLIHCGLLKFVNTRLYTKNMFQLMDTASPEQVVIEIPRVYPFSQQKTNPDDLIGLSVKAGICIAAASPFCQVQEIHPQEWKGQRPKKVDNKHTLKVLYDPIELNVLDKWKSDHNVLDAIGIGLWRLGRK